MTENYNLHDCETKNNIKSKVNPFSVCMVFVSTIIGVGFASGKEILEFFARFGAWGYVGIFVCAILFFATCYAFLHAGSSGCGESISHLNALLFPKKARIFADIFLCFSHLSVVSAMIAGVKSLFVMVGFSSWSVYASLIACVIIFFISLFSPYKLIKLCGYMTPLIVIIMIITCILTIFKGDYISANAVTSVSNMGNAVMAILASVLYAGMNLQTASPLVTPAGKFLSKKQRLRVSFVSAFILTLCLSLAVISLQGLPNNILSQDMPMLELSARFGRGYYIIYIIALTLGIFSTLLSSVFALSDICIPIFKTKTLSTFITIAFGFVMSLLGFSSIVKIVYPLVGVFGVIYILALLKYILKNKKQRK
ncbi:MAG: hypothetical protein RR334_02285 [Clostridia bacterium]